MLFHLHSFERLLVDSQDGLSLVSPLLSRSLTSGSNVRCPNTVPSTLIPVEDVAVVLTHDLSVLNVTRSMMMLDGRPSFFSHHSLASSRVLKSGVPS